ncbi:6-phosphogluconolactonase [uncultured Sulfitobacter sp.]|uniref:6-phosphogluconolactonase n=1 Tax=uncultured Sulfitobacter sp. TaxID=191468 RepID=UPI002631836D|nr:6-phosphogluconolactonase [uncultured Sulfitobacter sp.]
MNIVEYQSRDIQMKSVAAALAEDLRTALAQKGVVTLAVPGGTTPGPVFDALAATDLDWSRVRVLLSDERWVPESDAQSNAALIRERLITGAASVARFTPYYTDGIGIHDAAQDLSVALADMLPIDVLLLGMGADMHTASLFPDGDGLSEALAETAPMLLPMRIAGQSVARITLTAPVLRAALSTHLLITGQDKRDALVAAQDLPVAQAPVQTVLSVATIHWSEQ